MTEGKYVEKKVPRDNGSEEWTNGWIIDECFSSGNFRFLLSRLSLLSPHPGTVAVVNQFCSLKRASRKKKTQEHGAYLPEKGAVWH